MSDGAPSNAAKRSALEVIADGATDDVFMKEGDDEESTRG